MAFRSVTTRQLESLMTTPGMQAVHVEVPAGGGRDPVHLPVIVVHKGDGPRILFTGSNRGDEYEGPMAIMRMAREFGP